MRFGDGSKTYFMRSGGIFVRKKLSGIKIRYAECRVHELLLHFIFGAFFLAKELIEVVFVGARQAAVQLRDGI